MIMKNREEKIQDFINYLDDKIDIDIKYFCSTMDIDNSEDIYEAIENNGGFDIEIIYYSNAIEYLRQNDSSLHESIGIAVEYGYNLENINSEILASLLASQNIRIEFEELKEEIEEFFESLEEEEV